MFNEKTLIINLNLNSKLSGSVKVTTYTINADGKLSANTISTNTDLKAGQNYKFVHCTNDAYSANIYLPNKYAFQKVGLIKNNNTSISVCSQLSSTVANTSSFDLSASNDASNLLNGTYINFAKTYLLQNNKN